MDGVLKGPGKKAAILSIIIVLVLVAAALITSSGLPGGAGDEKTVVIYTSVDQIFSEPILKEYEEQTGVRVLSVYDVEATKTTGLVNRLIAEKDRPVADIFWNGEFSQTISLKEKGVLAPYASPSASDIPAAYIDPEGYWTGTGGRARVFLVNTDLLAPEHYPSSLFDLLDDTYSGGEIAIAYPLFGTSATHAAALYATIGPGESRAFYQDLADKGVRVVDGNSVVRDLVADGTAAVGLTDTDDALGALRRGAPVAIIVPDQQDGGMGTLIIPNTLALIEGAPHPDEGKKLIDYLLSRDVEGKLVESGWFQVPLRETGNEPEFIANGTIKGMSVNLNEIDTHLQAALGDLREIYIR